MIILIYAHLDVKRTTIAIMRISVKGDIAREENYGPLYFKGRKIARQGAASPL